MTMRTEQKCECGHAIRSHYTLNIPHNFDKIRPCNAKDGMCSCQKWTPKDEDGE